MTAEAQSCFDCQRAEGEGKTFVSVAPECLETVVLSPGGFIISNPHGILVISTGSDWMFSHIQKHLTSSHCCTSWPGSAAVRKERQFKCKY